MNDLNPVIQQITDNLDNRRFEINKLRRVLQDYIDNELESTVTNMTITMIYAQWESYVKEVCQLYLEHIESTVSYCIDLQPAILGYLWTTILRPLTGGLNFKRKTDVADKALDLIKTPVVFCKTEKAIDTKFNLKFYVLKDIAASLCLDITHLLNWEKHLDALVELRNHIAHGERPSTLRYEDFDKYASEIIQLMEDFEKILISALETKSFYRASSYTENQTNLSIS